MKKNFYEKLLESFLRNSRFLILLPIISLVILFGAIVVLTVFKSFLILQKIDVNNISFAFLGELISILDVILLGIIILIFSWWIYELFIDEIHIKKSQGSKAKLLIIHDIDELKEKVTKVIIIMLIVSIFKQILSFEANNTLDVLYLAISTLTLAIAAAAISFKPKDDQ